MSAHTFQIKKAEEHKKTPALALMCAKFKFSLSTSAFYLKNNENTKNVVNT